jgi:hypothetical protein
LRELADGKRRLADSAICQKDGKWYARLCYEIPTDGTGLPIDHVITLWPGGPDDKRPFRLTWKDAEGREGQWDLGDGLPLVAEYRRLIARRRAIKYRSRDGCGRGHGKGRFYNTIRPITRATRDMFERFRKQTIARLVQRAITAECGSLLYREPTKPVRAKTWFAAKDVPFPWCEFERQLAFKTEQKGLEYRVERLRMAEWLKGIS